MASVEELSRKYQVTLRPVPESDGNGFYAYSFKFPGVLGNGETADDAINDFYEALESAISIELEDGKQLPPFDVDDVQYSGKLSLRIPKSLHRMIAALAQEESISINQWIVNAISVNVGIGIGKKESHQTVNITLHNYYESSLQMPLPSGRWSTDKQLLGFLEDKGGYEYVFN
jgi:antitoxin HicB